MTAFFVGGIDARGPAADEAYRALRELSRDVVHCPARLRRIYKLRCRIDGRDEEIEVGKAPPHGEGVVAAILDHGRDEAFVVHTTTPTGATNALLRVPNPVYDVIEFAAEE